MAHILSVAVVDRFGVLVAEQGQRLDTERTCTASVKHVLFLAAIEKQGIDTVGIGTKPS